MGRRISPVATPLTRAWRDLADKAIVETAGAPHGERGRRVIEAAQRAQATPVLVRRAITVRVALMKLEDKGTLVPDVVWALPVGAAEAVARWASRDPDQAWAMAEAYAQNRITFEALIGAERTSREGESAARANAPTQDPAAAWRAAQVKAAGKTKRWRVLPPAVDDLPVAGWAYDDRAGPIALVVIGPCSTLDDYVAARAPACITAIGLARLVGRATMIVPSEDVRLRYRAWLTDRSVPENEVSVETVVPKNRRA